MSKNKQKSKKKKHTLGPNNMLKCIVWAVYDGGKLQGPGIVKIYLKKKRKLKKSNNYLKIKKKKNIT